MVTEPLSAERLAEMRREHDGSDWWCIYCETRTPCVPQILLAELDRRQDECIDCFARYATDPGVER